MGHLIRDYARIYERRHDDEWYEKHLEGIAHLDPEWQKEHKKQLAPGVKYSIKVDAAIHEFNDFINGIKREKKRYPTFSEFVLNAIKERGMSSKEFYIEARMDRKLFSAIKTNPEYQPKKETAVACCFALKLSLDDAEILLQCAGYSLSLSIQWDRVVYYCLREAITDIDDVNELLYELDEKLIRQ